MQPQAFDFYQKRNNSDSYYSESDYGNDYGDYDSENEDIGVFFSAKNMTREQQNAGLSKKITKVFVGQKQKGKKMESVLQSCFDRKINDDATICEEVV